MPVTETAFNKLSDRVRNLESQQSKAQEAPWTQRNQTLTWLITVTVGVVAWFIGVYAGVIPHVEKDQALEVSKQVTEGLKAPLQQIGQMSDDIAEIKGELKAWAPFVTPQFFKKTVSLSDKAFGESLPQLKTVAQIAAESKAEVPAKDIADIGKRTIALASGDSASSGLAWDTTTALLQYRSALNSSGPLPNTENATVLSPQVVVTKYYIRSAPGYEPSQLSTVGAVPRAQAAMLDLIGHDLNTNLDVGSAFLVMQGGGTTLDNMHMKNVVLMNVHVVYSGTPVILENVYFVNCTFGINKTANSEALSATLLEPSPTNSVLN